MTYDNVQRLISMTMVGCSMWGCSSQIVETASGPMPQYCTQNNTATGAIVGALLGAGLGAAIGGGRGAAIGAGAGAGLGGITGAQADAQCRQIAMQNFMQLMAQQAEAQRAAVAQGRAAQLQADAYQSVDYYTPAPKQGRAAQLQADAYQSVEYYTPEPKQGRAPVRHKITQTNSYTNPVTKESCGSFSEISFGDNDKGSVTGTGRVCTGADGKPHEA
jgi:hypothetical protein